MRESVERRLNTRGGDERNRLSRLYSDRENRWREFLGVNFPGARLVKWGGERRTFRNGSRAVKIQNLPGTAGEESSQDLRSECELLQRLEGYAWTLRPEFAVMREWAVLETDWIEGDDFDALISSARADSIRILPLLLTILRISKLGVVHKQLRARHLFLRNDGSVTCIDFGGSRVTVPILALFANVSTAWGLIELITRCQADVQSMRHYGTASRSGLRTAREKFLRIASTAAGIARRICRPSKPPAVFSQHRTRAELQWLLNRESRGGPNSERMPSGAVDWLRRSSEFVNSAGSRDLRIYEDTFKFELDDYFLRGRGQWGYIWEHIRQTVEFTGKRIVDLGCTQGMCATFARIEGAAEVTAIDNVPELVKAARCFANAFDINDNRYICADIDGVNLLEYNIDIVVLLSSRYGSDRESQVKELLSTSAAFIYQTRGDREEEIRGLMSRGYIVTPIATSGTGREIVYARPPVGSVS